MDEREPTSMVGRLMNQLETSLGAGPFPENTQIVIRPIFTWPDGAPVVWVAVNTPN